MNYAVSTQLGYTPYVSGKNALDGNASSKIVAGRNTGKWEAIGLGSNGRPDYLNNFIINLTNTVLNGDSKFDMPGIVSINVSDLISVINAPSSHAPTQFDFRMREVSVCEQDDAGNTTEKRMMLLGSQTYLPSGSP